VLQKEGTRKRYGGWLIGLLALLLVAVLSQSIASARSQTEDASGGLTKANPQSQRMSSAPRGPAVVAHELKHDTSARLDSMPDAAPIRRTEREMYRHVPNKPGIQDVDSVVQRKFGPLVMPAPIVNVEGIDFLNSTCNCAPPDTNGDVGPNHYVQTVNTAYQVFTKAGVPTGPARAINTLWTGFGGACEARNDGDPIVKYDQMADRWLINQFTTVAPFTQCIAVSTSPDPNGA